ncbi:GTPase [Endozoicomonas sp.]|uniref:GTPase n=1 Tax=Endozoicomonas sp. TaxID=1892382 RepID=UPI003AF77136
MDPNTPDKFPNTVNIGVVGQSDAGKGSLINALRGIAPRNPEAAKTGVSATCQEETKRYQLSDSQFLCELPAYGSYKWPTQHFSEQTKLLKYDALIIVVSVGASDSLQITQQAKDAGIPFHIVRAKADRDIEDGLRDNGLRPEETMQKISEEMSTLPSRNRLRPEGLYHLNLASKDQGGDKPSLAHLQKALLSQKKLDKW